jgi:hypothetical protein
MSQFQLRRRIILLDGLLKNAPRYLLQTAASSAASVNQALITKAQSLIQQYQGHISAQEVSGENLISKARSLINRYLIRTKSTVEAGEKLIDEVDLIIVNLIHALFYPVTHELKNHLQADDLRQEQKQLVSYFSIITNYHAAENLIASGSAENDFLKMYIKLGKKVEQLLLKMRQQKEYYQQISWPSRKAMLNVVRGTEAGKAMKTQAILDEVDKMELAERSRRLITIKNALVTDLDAPMSAKQIDAAMKRFESADINEIDQAYRSIVAAPRHRVSRDEKQDEIHFTKRLHPNDASTLERFGLELASAFESKEKNYTIAASYLAKLPFLIKCNLHRYPSMINLDYLYQAMIAPKSPLPKVRAQVNVTKTVPSELKRSMSLFTFPQVQHDSKLDVKSEKKAESSEVIVLKAIHKELIAYMDVVKNEIAVRAKALSADAQKKYFIVGTSSIDPAKLIEAKQSGMALDYSALWNNNIDSKVTQPELYSAIDRAIELASLIKLAEKNDTGGLVDQYHKGKSVVFTPRGLFPSAKIDVLIQRIDRLIESLVEEFTTKALPTL